jgi:membrane protease YdiL (CAAX protease family)
MPYNLKVFSAAVLNPSEFRSNRFQLKETLDKIKFIIAPNMTKEAINNMTNSKAILNADCPYQEYLNQVNLLSGENNTPESIARVSALQLIVIPVVAEELIFRGLLQDVILKRLVGKVVQKIAPSHAGLVDSKIYTAIRIALTTYAFMSIHEANRAIMADSYVDKQLVGTIIMGIGFGILKEAKGLSWAIGAHAINNLSASLPGMMMKC